MNQVTSKDGTSIAFDRMGSGPAVILVSGGSVDRQSNAGVAANLAPDFTVFNYDRRGRGPSGNTLPYAIEREVEDIAAVAAAAGGSAYLYGSSSGAALALIAARGAPRHDHEAGPLGAALHPRPERAAARRPGRAVQHDAGRRAPR